MIVAPFPVAQNPPAQVRAELVCAVRSVAPGKSFLAAVVLTIEPGWHVYWKNPGDTGIPTTIHWNAPRGWRVQPLEWPTPQVIRSQETVSFGYSRQVAFLAKITPSGVKAGRVGSTAKWLVCKEACVPGAATLAQPIVIGPTRSDPVWASRLSKLANALPKHDSRWTFLAARQGDAVELTAKGYATSNLTFFPIDTNAFASEPSAGVRQRDGTVALSLKRSDFAASNPSRLRGLLVVGHRALIVDVPIQNRSR